MLRSWHPTETRFVTTGAFLTAGDAHFVKCVEDNRKISPLERWVAGMYGCVAPVDAIVPSVTKLFDACLGRIGESHTLENDRSQQFFLDSPMRSIVGELSMNDTDFVPF